MDQFNYLDAYHDAMAILRCLDHVSALFLAAVKERSASPEAMVKWLAMQHQEIIYVHMNLFCCWKKTSHSISQMIMWFTRHDSPGDPGCKGLQGLACTVTRNCSHTK